MSESADRRPSFVAVALALGIAGVIAAVLVLPYQVQLQLASGAERPAWTDQLPVWVLYLLSALLNAAPVVIVVPVGLWASRRLDFRMPLTEALIGRKPLPEGIVDGLGVAAFVGFGTGIAITCIDLAYFAQAMPQHATSGMNPPAWMGLLASFYGGINEELLARFFFLSLIALGLRTLVRAFGADRSRALPGGVFWTANILAALFFGASHLPAAAALAPLTGALVLRTFLLNGLLALAFGWLYRRSGLEAAMLAHFCSDLALHVIAPLLSGTA